jgi:pimeloyl-ACP methyl ester carboxylesterase
MVLPSLLAGGTAGAGLLGAGLLGFNAWTAARVEAALPPQGDTLTIDGNRIQYLDAGSGPPVVLLHGLGGQMRNFTYGLVDRLTGEFRVIVPDRPGSGHSVRAPGASARLGVQADVIAGLIGALQLDRPLLVGHSLGGALALVIALKHPGLARGLALISPLTQPQETVPAAFRGLAVSSKLLRWLIAWTLSTPMAMAKRDRVLDALFGPELPPDDLALRAGFMLALRPKSFYASSSDLMAAREELPGLQARYGNVQAPVSILFGDGDQILDPRLHGESMVRQIPGLSYTTLAGGGHMIPLTRPDEVAAFIARMHASLCSAAKS